MDGILKKLNGWEYRNFLESNGILTVNENFHELSSMFFISGF